MYFYIYKLIKRIVFKIDIVYKDAKGVEHELKWIIKVTRSDVNETADKLLRHEKQVFSRLLGDLVNMVKQRGAGRAEGARLSATEVLKTPEFIFEESSHQVAVVFLCTLAIYIKRSLFLSTLILIYNIFTHFRLIYYEMC